MEREREREGEREKEREREGGRVINQNMLYVIEGNPRRKISFT